MICHLVGDHPSDLASVAAARHECFKHLGSDEKPLREEFFADQWDQTPNSRSYVMRNRDAEIIGTIRISIFDPKRGLENVPARPYFPEILDRTFSDHGAVQASMLAVRPKFRVRNVDTALSLLRSGVATALANDIPDFVAIVTAKEAKVGFWSRIGLLPRSELVPHPLTPEGAVFIAGKVSTMIQSAEANPRLGSLVSFAEKQGLQGGFPVVA